MSGLIIHWDETELKLEDDIAQLESRLAKAKQRLSYKRQERHQQIPTAAEASSSSPITPINSTPPASIHGQGSSPLFDSSSQHYLLLLSDSALPLGSFAFSSGLESYIAHARGPLSSSVPSSSPYLYKPTFSSFLPLSLSSYASTNLPFALAAYRSLSSSSSSSVSTIAELDDVLDASIVCTVGRRASIAQGRALLSIWEKSLSVSITDSGSGSDSNSNSAALAEFSALLRRSSSSSSSTTSFSSTTSSANTNTKTKQNEEKEKGAGNEESLPPPVSAHLAPLFGAVSAALGLSLRQTAYVFLLSHAKALVSAAVRAGMFGPYQAQRILAGAEVQTLISGLVEREWDVPVEEAGQSVPVMDFWIGRHEMLYSRIFNS
jgi:urease accessory protein